MLPERVIAKVWPAPIEGSYYPAHAVNKRVSTPASCCQSQTADSRRPVLGFP